MTTSPFQHNAYQVLMIFHKHFVANNSNLMEDWFYSNSISALHIDGPVQDCSISSANALEILHSCTKPSISPQTLLHGMMTHLS